MYGRLTLARWGRPGANPDHRPSPKHPGAGGDPAPAQPPRAAREEGWRGSHPAGRAGRRGAAGPTLETPVSFSPNFSRSPGPGKRAFPEAAEGKLRSPRWPGGGTGVQAQRSPPAPRGLRLRAQLHPAGSPAPPSPPLPTAIEPPMPSAPGPRGSRTERRGEGPEGRDGGGGSGRLAERRAGEAAWVWGLTSWYSSSRGRKVLFTHCRRRLRCGARCSHTTHQGARYSPRAPGMARPRARSSAAAAAAAAATGPGRHPRGPPQAPPRPSLAPPRPRVGPAPPQAWPRPLGVHFSAGRPAQNPFWDLGSVLA